MEYARTMPIPFPRKRKSPKKSPKRKCLFSRSVNKERYARGVAHRYVDDFSLGVSSAPKRKENLEAALQKDHSQKIMATLSSVEARLATLEQTVADKTAEADTFYLLWAAGLVFLMQVAQPLENRRAHTVSGDTICCRTTEAQIAQSMDTKLGILVSHHACVFTHPTRARLFL